MRIMMLAAAALLVAAPTVAAAADADILREAQDRADIEQLMWRYSRATDTFDADAYVAVFTPDGAFGATKGRDALRKMIEGFRKGPNGPPSLYHAESNRWIEFIDRDHARVHYYWQTYAAPPKQPPRAAAQPANPQAAAAAAVAVPPRLLAVGNGINDVVRIDGKWLIRKRNVVAQE